MKKKTKIITIAVSALVAALALAVAIPFTILGVKTSGLKRTTHILKTTKTIVLG